MHSNGFFRDTFEIILLYFAALNKQIREEWTTVPKGMAILMGGMAGYILGIRRLVSFLRRWFYSFTGLATMAAFCYPEETAHFFRTGIAHSKMAWENFKESPEPSVDSNIDEPTDTENVPKPSETVDESVTVNEK
uniref:MICOS complex subunit n=1 Tax=Syphacia muris TaxID=451379 RepID=A0A0N5B1B7_9BILA